jgi:chemotaxis protein methyltransferase CheR
MNDQQFRQLLNQYEFSWAGYRKVRKGVKKRIDRFMKSIGCRNMADFLAELDKNDVIKHQCELLMTVSISRFFRDRGVWEYLKKNILPGFIRVDKENIKCWSAGCACGEEVYSLKIIWDLLSKDYSYIPGLNILATDINPTYLDRARAGIYTQSSLKEVTKEIQFGYFKQKGSKKLFEVKTLLKKDIEWKKHHLLSDAPGSNFDIIFLRNNVLTYYEDRLKNRAFSNVIKGLAPCGILVLGSHEKVPFETSVLKGVGPYSFVFRKI